ncbi:NAD-binding protein [Fomitiporia mediterranea MF3/22]|uniref:NAD-binding protein n=1 Tax=Fomitiporia mediterranea (strain MF3/22) TaxID=694068 RepID=UPI000440801B|nr:NAD-binding protein [Fomitiporia mediterranea MF3/22]EJD06806.1 NAD-binding protein [Fomitiporia mediterranea MF3/22]
MGSLFTRDDQATPVTPFTSYTPRVAIVTGSAQGIGYAIAHRLADDGIDVAVNDLVSKQDQIDAVVDELRKKGRCAIAVPGDISSEADVIAIVEKTVQELGSVDIMVANAAISQLCSFLHTSVESYDSVLGVNARGVFMCFKYAAVQMVKQGRGGRLIGQQNLVAYVASKFAVRGIVQTASIELRRHGITVNAYAPGTIRTGACKACLTNFFAVADVIGPIANAPLGEPEDIASLISYLAKPESFFINGSVVQSSPVISGCL